MDSGFGYHVAAGNRLTRRRFVRGTATAGLAAAAAGLVGCSSSNNGKNNTGAKVSATAPAAGQSGASPAASAARATAAATRAGSPAAGIAGTPTAADNSLNGKAGGTLKFMLASYPTTFHAIEGSTNYNSTGFCYGGLLAMQWNREGVAPDAYTLLEPDVAQAMPEQPDDTTLVYKIRPGVKFHNGRALTSDDVKYSLNRWENTDKSTLKGEWDAWLDHVETPDPQTAVLKTKYPFVDAVLVTASNTSGFMLAKEHEEGPDYDSKYLGTGPFMWSDAQPPVSITVKRNPDYYLKPFPYFDQVQMLATTDPVARVTNFITKQVTIPWHVYASDRDQIKKQRPDAKFEQDPGRAPAVQQRNDKAPFSDPRVRQALSYGIDRKKVRDTANEGEGVDDQYFNVMYKSLLGTSDVKDLGDPAKYWQYNPQAAKQLFAAAGLTQPIETTMGHYTPSVVGQWIPDMATLIQAGWKDLGLANAKDFPDPQWSNNSTVGNYDGMGFSISDGINSGSPAIALTIRNTWYWGPNGEHSGRNNTYTSDQTLSGLADKQVRQLNKQERQQSFKQMEQIIAAQQYYIMTSTTFQSWFWDPSLRNVAWSVEQGSFRNMMKWWFA